MKKFLFTLAALFVAGSAFAESSFYIEDVELQESQLGSVVVLPIKCHTDVAFNTAEINFEYDGNFTVNNTLQKLTPAFTITYIEDEFGTEATNSFATNVMGNAVEQHKVMFFIATNGYWDPDEDGEYEAYGAVKWMPGDYTFFNLRITPAADFTEGTIRLFGFFASGNDTRPIETAGDALNFDTTCHLTLHQDTPPPTPDADAPVITFTPDDNGVAIAVAPCTSYEVIVNGENLGQIDYVAAEYDVTKNIVVNAVNAPQGYNPAEASDNYTLQPKPYAPAVDPVITFTPVEGGVNIAVDPYTSYEVIVNGVNMGQIDYVAQADVERVIVVNATNAPAHQEVGTATATYTLEAATPVTPTEQCLNPNAGYEITGYELATVTITNREPGATVTYVVYVKNDEGEWEEMNTGEFTGDSFSFDVQGDGTYRVECVAHLQGKLDSDPGAVEFTIHEGETSGVAELVNGKEIASKRFFNLAGQEMQEVNGVTIVVTTYTDGTTSAVKVMK